MTFRVAKSQIFPDFEVAVAAHASEMKAWRAHMGRVVEDEKNGVTGIDKHAAHPAPAAHPLVEAAVNENDVADYEIVDDGPTPEQVLAAKKNELLGIVSMAEQRAIAGVLPLGKRRLFHLREEDIRAADAQRSVEFQRGIVGAAAAAVGLTKPIDVTTELEKRRPADDTAHLASQAERREKIAAIERTAAQMHADIEDLTIETIDAWTMTKFPD